MKKRTEIGTKKNTAPISIAGHGRSKPPAQSAAISTSDSRPGWSFYSTWLTCKRLWFLRYVARLMAGKGQALLIGSAYHALREGKSLEDVAEKFGTDAAVGGSAAFSARNGRSMPPIPAARVREQTLALPPPLNGVFFSTPDQIDAGSNCPRDFKTARKLYGDEQEKWNIDGEIIGELLATGADHCIVDIITKEQKPDCRLVMVSLTESKKQAFVRLIQDALDDMRERWRLWEQDPKNTDADKVYPKQLTACVRFGKCDFYDYCWGAGKFEHEKKLPWVSKLMNGERIAARIVKS